MGALLVVWTAGCAQPPTADVEAARAKVQAIAAGDAAYAPDAHKAAQDALAELDAEMAAQNQKFALTRSYARVVELAAAAATAADRVEQAASSEKQRLRTEAGRAVDEAKRALVDATASLGTVPRAQGEALKADLGAAEASLAEVDSLLAAGQFKEARQKAETARLAVNQLTNSIQAAAQAEAERPSPDRTVVPRAVLADGNRLAAGTYRLRVTDESAPSVAGQPATTGRWVEFLRNGKVAGRALAVVLTAAEVREVAKSQGPGRNEVRVELLKGYDYVRVWLNQGGTNYLIHLPVAS